MTFRSAIIGLGAFAGLALAAAPAAADVKAGVEAWSRGDYARAVTEWKGPASRGDADAEFNMAQAYRLGRGVSEDLEQAEALYARAAAKGHVKAADNYGLLLFQDGRREAAMPYVGAAAERGDPRAQYLIGVAHFNGDLLAKDWVRAYALLTLANSAGLPQAAPALKQMDDFIPLDQRQEAQSLAVDLKRSADAQRASQLAASDLAMGVGEDVAPPPRQAAAIPPRIASRPVPQPIPETAVTPSVAAAEAAVAEAMRATGTESPAAAGADYARPGEGSPVRVASAPPVEPRTQQRPSPRTVNTPSVPNPPASPKPAAPAASKGPWKVQLGAFGVPGNAEKLWAHVGGKGALAGKQRVLQPAGRLTKLLAGGWPSRDTAQAACNSLKAGGQDCIVTR